MPALLISRIYEETRASGASSPVSSLTHAECSRSRITADTFIQMAGTETGTYPHLFFITDT